eukprot:m.100806 g.100806  ORF g.100806 m.100806 type:complete len:175 (-) comp14953_c1_seq1:335-859(-)
MDRINGRDRQMCKRLMSKMITRYHQEIDKRQGQYEQTRWTEKKDDQYGQTRWIEKKGDQYGQTINERDQQMCKQQPEQHAHTRMISDDHFIAFIFILISTILLLLLLLLHLPSSILISANDFHLPPSISANDLCLPSSILMSLNDLVDLQRLSWSSSSSALFFLLCLPCSSRCC